MFFDILEDHYASEESMLEKLPAAEPGRNGFAFLLPLSTRFSLRAGGMLSACRSAFMMPSTVSPDISNAALPTTSAIEVHG